MIPTWWTVPAQSCDRELWRCIMAAMGAQAVPPADMSSEALSQVFQVLALMHAHSSAEPMTLLAPPCTVSPLTRQETHHQVPEAAVQTVHGVANLHSTQAYELLCLDMPAEQAALAAAAPPGLLDAARARWAERALQASSSAQPLQVCSTLRGSAICQLPREHTCTGCNVFMQSEFARHRDS